MLIKITNSNGHCAPMKAPKKTDTNDANGYVVIKARGVCLTCGSLPQEQRPPFEMWERCTLHGIHDLASAKEAYTKVFWAVAFVFALSMGVYGCYMIVNEYLRQPVVVSYVVQEPDPKKGGTVQLPDIIVCPFNRLNQSYLNEVNVAENLTDFIQLAFGFGTPYEFHRNYMENLKQFVPPDRTNYSELFNISAREMDELLSRLNMTFGEFLENASPRCEATIDHCVRNHNPYDCCATAKPVMVGSGRCYRVIGHDQHAAGYGFGMTVIIKLQTELFTSAVNNLHNDGVMLKLAERNKGHDFDITFLPLGTHALMPLRATKYKFMHYPPTYECLTMNETVTYSRIGCFESCLFEESYAECHCQHAAAMMKKFPPCSTTQVEWCLWPAARRSWGPNGNQKVSDCKKKCKAPCEYWQYTSSISYSKFPSETIRRYVRDGEEWDRYQNMIILDVFHERLEYTVIEHYPRMTPHTFIANIGGQIGLWVGGSILTLLQVCVYIGRSLERLFRRKAPARDDCTIPDGEHLSLRLNSARTLSVDARISDDSPKFSIVPNFEAFCGCGHPLHNCCTSVVASPLTSHSLERNGFVVESRV